MTPAGRVPADVDVLIVGSGPIGAAYARVISSSLPSATLLMVDRGPALTPRPGTNLKNYLPNGALASPAGPEAIPVVPAGTMARSGTVLFDPRGPRPGHMPAAAVSTNVGGMGAHWSCATPGPGDDEQIAWIGDDERSALLAEAANLLDSSTQAFGASARGAVMIEKLSAAFAGLVDRPVQVMPHACRRLPTGRLLWTGADTVLGPLTEGSPTFELRAGTLCRRLVVEAGRVVGAEIVDVATGHAEQVTARIVVAACDSLRTPQLLWASGIRPAALGRYLNEHAMVGGTVVLSDEIMARAEGRDGAHNGWADDPLGAVWIPYAATHRFSGQINSSPGSPAGFAVEGLEGVAKERIISLTWFCPKHPRREDRIDFLDEVDADGLPVPDIHYALTAEDHTVVGEGIRLATEAGTALGTFVAGQTPCLLADGQSLHYMGTLRMGATDDAMSVCDGHSRVWGVQGLYVGGNGVIPTATACNPTLTSTALAVRGARQIIEDLRQ